MSRLYAPFFLIAGITAVVTGTVELLITGRAEIKVSGGRRD